MNEFEMSQYITEAFEGVDVVTDRGNSFVFYNPDKDVPPDHRFPFVTLVVNDLYDQFSDLDRPGIFRLNIGVSKQTFRALFGETVRDYDFTTLNQVMPHPLYGRMFWVCLLNPGDEAFQVTVRPLLTEAYDMAVSKYRRKAGRR